MSQKYTIFPPFSPFITTEKRDFSAEKTENAMKIRFPAALAVHCGRRSLQN